MRLVYDPRRLARVTIVRLGVVGVLQMVSEPTLRVLWVCASQLRRIQ
jgi:hypothetical protein